MQPTPVGKQTYFNHCFKKKKKTPEKTIATLKHQFTVLK